MVVSTFKVCSNETTIVDADIKKYPNEIMKLCEIKFLDDFSEVYYFTLHHDTEVHLTPLGVVCTHFHNTVHSRITQPTQD